MSDYAKLIKKMHDMENQYITESFKSGKIKLNEDDNYDFPSDIDDRTLRGLLAEIKKLRKEVAKLKSEKEDLEDELKDITGSSSSRSRC